jgi:tRNA threonylcarbamoyladenosine biosynthesis protein TsaE
MPVEEEYARECVELTTAGPDETRRIGRVLGGVARPGDVFLLAGELGAGKTCLTQGILRGLGSDETARSPTFVLVSEYSARLTLYHVDLYRLKGGVDVLDLGLEEYLEGDGVTVVEWADRAPGLLGEEYMSIDFERVDDETRRLRVSADGAAFAEAFAALRAARAR